MRTDVKYHRPKSDALPALGDAHDRVEREGEVSAGVGADVGRGGKLVADIEADEGLQAGGGFKCIFAKT